MGKFKNNFPEVHVTPHAWINKGTTDQYTAIVSILTLKNLIFSLLRIFKVYKMQNRPLRNVDRIKFGDYSNGGFDNSP